MLGFEIGDGKVALGRRVRGTNLQRLLVERNRLGGLALAGEHNTEIVQSRQRMGINFQGAPKILRGGRQIPSMHCVGGLLEIRVQLRLRGVCGRGPNLRRGLARYGLGCSGGGCERAGCGRPEQYWQPHTPNFKARGRMQHCQGEIARPHTQFPLHKNMYGI
jgi:hypothetical protein